KRVQFANDLQQNVLRDILGIGIVAEHTPGEIVNSRRIIAEHALRRQLAVGGFGHATGSTVNRLVAAKRAKDSQKLRRSPKEGQELDYGDRRKCERAIEIRSVMRSCRQPELPSSAM